MTVHSTFEMEKKMKKIIVTIEYSGNQYGCDLVNRITKRSLVFSVDNRFYESSDVAHVQSGALKTAHRYKTCTSYHALRSLLASREGVTGSGNWSLMIFNQNY